MWRRWGISTSTGPNFMALPNVSKESSLSEAGIRTFIKRILEVSRGFWLVRMCTPHY